MEPMPGVADASTEHVTVVYRYVVVVPRSAPETLDYLTASFKDIPDVEVVLDRRDGSTMSVGILVEQRGVRWTQDAFGCTLVRVARPVPTPCRDTPVASPPPPASLVAPASLASPARLGVHAWSAIRWRTPPLLREV